MSTSAPDDQTDDSREMSNMPSEDTSLDQVRDLLFGTQSRDFDARLGAMQDQLQRTAAELHALLGSRADSLDQRINAEVRDLKQQLESNQQRADKRAAEQQEHWQRMLNELQQQLSSQVEAQAASERAMQANFDRQLGEVREHVLERMDALRNHLQAEIAQVSGASVARRTLSDALRELSTRLDGE
jgi:DNA anti-recombination protein RmuC